MDLRAALPVRLLVGDAVRSLTAPSMILPSWAASPTPVLTTIFYEPGHLVHVREPKSFASWAETLVSSPSLLRGRG
jgi:hypothetical protein